MQVTGQSLLGNFGRSAKSVAVDLMNRDLVHFIASDAHDTAHRPPVLREAYNYVEKTWGGARWRRYSSLPRRQSSPAVPSPSRVSRSDTSETQMVPVGFLTV